MTKAAKTTSWVFQIIAVIIMGQTLAFKFSGHPTTLAIFEEINMPYGHIIIGVLELAACILLLMPQSIVYGATLGAGLMTGAIIGHITELGWEGERGQLGLLAIATLVSCNIVLFIRRKDIPLIKGILSESNLPKD
ncbi:DoxX family protein [Puniceicoccaceae bacterium K14]|nr:DoxX family protein [Puniceicoccaceae bacterium K14]